jgi:hypothetical protein
VLRFINLLPNYAPPGALSGNSTAPMSYGEYVQAYIKAVDPQLLCMDHCESSVADMEGVGKIPQPSPPRRRRRRRPASLHHM